MGVGCHSPKGGGGYSCIHSVFNQWIKLSIYSSIDVRYDKCLSMLSRQGRRHWRPFNHPSQRWAEAEKNYPAAALGDKEKRVGGVSRWWSLVP